MTLFLTALIAGLAVGSVYGLIALSYTVVFNSTSIFNIAQGDLMMFGVLAAYFCLDRWHLGQLVTLLVIIGVVVTLSLVEERVAVRPFVKRPVVGLGWFIATLAFSLILETVASIIYGQNPVVAIPGALGNLGLCVQRNTGCLLHAMPLVRARPHHSRPATILPESF